MIGFPRGKIAFRMFEENDLESLHWGTLDVLENAGIKVFSKECLKLLEDAGCSVDYKDSSAKIPGNLVEESIRKAKKNITLCARNPKYDVVLDGRRTYCTTDGNGTSVLDFKTGKRRMSTSRGPRHGRQGRERTRLRAHLLALRQLPGHTGLLPGTSSDLKVALMSIEKHVQVETTSHQTRGEVARRARLGPRRG